jgi:tRNA 5-methylaminomethyl-2-thiouridine biosynthesis bifunctional protein
MSEPLDWLPGGTPYSRRFRDRYHSSAHHGLDQARGAFLGGCGLPAAWAGQAQWRILETGFGLGLNFLVTWAAWRADPARPRLLHFVSCEAWPVSAADLLRAAPQEPELQALARQLAARFWGLLPGVHRLAFEGGRVLLTLYIGDAQAMLRQQRPVADSVYLDGFAPPNNPEMWSAHTLKAVARCCRRGAHLATWCVARAVRDGLAQCGFAVRAVPGVPPKRENLQATYDPRWQPRHTPVDDTPAAAPARCLVIGAGLAGAAVAASLARRGWQVRVLDAAPAPAAGASGLLAGVFAPHTSPDDSLLSRLSRAGVRATLETLEALAPGDKGVDWNDCGVLERSLGGPPALAWSDGPGLDWSLPASAAQIAASGLPPQTHACWHARGGWVRPTQLVLHLLAQPGITWQGNAPVARLHRTPAGPWQALDAQGAPLAEAELAVICAGARGLPLLPWPLQLLRGQIAWSLRAHMPQRAPWPPWPVNGHGNLVPCAPLAEEGMGWALGSTFERDMAQLPPSAADTAAAHAANHAKLSALLPALGQSLAPAFALARQGQGPVRAWAALRCAAPDRLPITGPVDATRQPGLWTSTAMGARGLTLALLCAELLAAHLHAEPLPLDARLAHALGSERMQKR